MHARRTVGRILTSIRGLVVEEIRHRGCWHGTEGCWRHGTEGAGRRIYVASTLTSDKVGNATNGASASRKDLFGGGALRYRRRTLVRALRSQSAWRLHERPHAGWVQRELHPALGYNPAPEHVWGGLGRRPYSCVCVFLKLLGP